MRKRNREMSHLSVTLPREPDLHNPSCQERERGLYQQHGKMTAVYVDALRQRSTRHLG